ncbi:MAG TPA: CHASE2 domain-containing protein [Bryobacteraceae bacterium]|nr:CHASE2 domain-containing protein [Bryobacteraceae bacterium]
MKRKPRITGGYVAVLVGAFALALIIGWQDIAERMSGQAYDWMFRSYPAGTKPPVSIVVAFDEPAIESMQGMRNLRGTLARVLDRLQQASPKVIAIDIILTEPDEPAQDSSLAAALKRSGNVVLAADLLPEQDRWRLPIAPFRQHAAAVGHVHAHPDPVSREIPLEHTGGRQRYWAMALEAFRLAQGNVQIIEEPKAIHVGSTRIPGARDTARALYIQYRQDIPTLPVGYLLTDDRTLPALRDKAVFVGVTSLSAAHDRLMTPLNRMMTGVEIHAQAFETLSSGRYLVTASHSLVVLICAGLTVAAGMAFSFLSGWRAYAAGALLIGLAQASPHVALGNGVILPYLAPILAAWLSVVTAAAWQYFVVRRQLLKSESDKARYQQAIHFVTHEMRSPLTAIQGSSELMGRYNLNEDKRKQMAQMINSESKRLAKMIQTFLDMERLTDGEMEIRSERVSIAELLQTCVERARHLAERKQIRLEVSPSDNVTVQGDRELLEYAIYNLLTNAVKYSPDETVVTSTIRRDGQHLRLSVIDQGIGRDEKELGNIFRKFYRTRKAETSGEAGTGIGLSIVDQIVTHHGGKMEVTSVPGQGSCFTMVLPVTSPSWTVPENRS